jgi:transglutaminase-like putative cysteine protease
MGKIGVSCLAFVLWSAVALAAEPAGKLVLDNWDVAYLEKSKVGFFRTTVREIEKDGKKVYRTNLEMDLTIKRYNAEARLRMENGTEETEAGKVTAVFMRQFLANKQTLELNGAVEDGQLHLTIDKGNVDKKIPWNDEVIGLYAQERFFQQKKAKPGDKFTYQSFEPTLSTVVTVQAVVKDEEEVEFLGGKKRRLLRVEATPDKVEVPGTKIQLPTMVSWLDKDSLPVRSQLELPGLGKIFLYRTTKDIARAPVDSNVKLPDLGLAALVPLNKAIKQPYDAKAVVYRITLKGDDEPTTAFAVDNRQEVKNAKGSSFELHVHAIREPDNATNDARPDKEFLESCYFLDSADGKVKELTRQAVGDQRDPWKKAKLIERWVCDNMRNSNSAEFGTAGQIARNLEGDCRQHAMLTAAMCRAAGVPSRTALGLVYVTDHQKGPVMGFHMWAEVWINGQWIGIDATLGRGSVGATHVKIADASWHDTHDQKPLLPVTRVLGKVTMEVVSVEDTK